MTAHSTPRVSSARRASAPGWPRRGSRPMPCCVPPRAARARHGTASPTPAPGAPEPVFSHGLYHAAPADMLNAIRDSDAVRAGGGGPQPRDRIARLVALPAARASEIRSLPDGCHADPDFDVDHMSDIAPGQGQVGASPCRASCRSGPDPLHLSQIRTTGLKGQRGARGSMPLAPRAVAPDRVRNPQ
jgi:hypothetical protein